MIFNSNSINKQRVFVHSRRMILSKIKIEPQEQDPQTLFFILYKTA